MADVNMGNQNVTENQTATEAQTGAENAGTSTGTEVTMESLMSEIAKLKADGAKTKAALDKALKEKGDITKQYREVLTEAQQAKIDKETADEEHRQYVESLEQFKAKAEAKARYALQGMSEEMALKAAEAEIAGDMDELAVIQKQHTEAVIKEKQAEWLNSRPPVNAGQGNGALTKEQFDKMSLAEKSKLYRENQAEYERLNG